VEKLRPTPYDLRLAIDGFSDWLRKQPRKPSDVIRLMKSIGRDNEVIQDGIKQVLENYATPEFKEKVEKVREAQAMLQKYNTP
jgi:hypothetical protein